MYPLARLGRRGAIVYANDLSNFKGIKRKASRVIRYQGDSKFETIHEEIFLRGYAVSFNEIFRYLKMVIPTTESISESGIRTEKYLFPDLAVREIIANSMIHQDFSISGTGVTIELFDNRLVVTNPGRPIVNIILITYINMKMQEQGLYKDYTVQQLLDKLDVIECFSYPGHELRIGEVLDKQKSLLSDWV